MLAAIALELFFIRTVFQNNTPLAFFFAAGSVRVDPHNPRVVLIDE